MQTFAHGFLVCFGLIASIGAQNAFLLKQGILKQHVFVIATLCFLCDVILMGLGVFGMGSLLEQSPVASLALAIFGAIFLFTYGSRSFIAAYRGEGELQASQGNSISLKNAVMITLAITLLNPHVYIDTVVIIGGIGGTLDTVGKWQFLSGALFCSALWFYVIGYGAGLLAPYFKKRRTWQILDIITGLIMYVIAFSLAVYALKMGLNL